MRDVDGQEGPTNKVVLLGDSRVGKTSIIARQLLGTPAGAQAATVGCHCSQIRVAAGGEPVVLQVWDTGGQEIYRSLVPVYLRGARAGLLVYDIADLESFRSLGHWYDLLHDAVPAGVRLFVAANKADLAERAAVDDGLAAEFAAVHGALFFRVSAATGEGLPALFERIALELRGDAAPTDARWPEEQEQVQQKSCSC
jgi:small GTP-binding protein